MRRSFADVANAGHQFPFLSQRAVESDLRLVSGRKVGRRIDDAPVEGKKGFRRGGELSGDFGEVGIEPNAEEAAAGCWARTRRSANGADIRA